MTTIDLMPQKIREHQRNARTKIAQVRRQRYRFRRRAQGWAETLADRLRPASIDSHDPGRFTAVLTLSSSLIPLVFVLGALLVVALYGPAARDTLRAIGFQV